MKKCYPNLLISCLTEMNILRLTFSGHWFAQLLCY